MNPSLFAFLAVGIAGGLAIAAAFWVIRAWDRRHPPTGVGTTHITAAGGNVFADLGFPPEEAAQLKARSDARIRAQLAQQAQADD